MSSRILFIANMFGSERATDGKNSGTKTRKYDKVCKDVRIMNKDSGDIFFKFCIINYFCKKKEYSKNDKKDFLVICFDNS